jgi:hypothetical protein
MQCAQSDDRPRHAGLRPDPLIREPRRGEHSRQSICAPTRRNDRHGRSAGICAMTALGSTAWRRWKTESLIAALADHIVKPSFAYRASGVQAIC